MRQVGIKCHCSLITSWANSDVTPDWFISKKVQLLQWKLFSAYEMPKSTTFQIPQWWKQINVNIVKWHGKVHSFSHQNSSDHQSRGTFQLGQKNKSRPDESTWECEILNEHANTVEKYHASILCPFLVKKLQPSYNMLQQQILFKSSGWFEPIRTVSPGRSLSWGTLFPQMSLEQQKKVMNCTVLCSLIIKAASVGIGPCVSGSALQSGNTSEIPPSPPTHLWTGEG